jgi:tRNA threonylcarbamoyladenosine biosynthesis protein TsaE
MAITLRSEGPEQTRSVGASFAGLLQANDVMLLSGDLGAGKTEFAKGVAQGLGVTEPVNSPTFTLLLVHTVAQGASTSLHSLYHFDLYRLDDASQLDDLDYFGMLEDGAVSLVEWGDRFAQALPEDHLLVELVALPGGERQMTFTAVGRRSSELLDAWARDAG